MKLMIRVLSVLLLMLVSISAVGAQDSLTAGQAFQLQGQVMDTAGNPIKDAVVEIWQTDSNGNYNHPNDAPTSALDKTFQYFGTATTDEKGYYAFLTIKPAAYESRPPHIHLRVKIAGAEALTSQFYFEEDRKMAEADGVFRAGGEGDSLFLQAKQTPDTSGKAIWLATGNLILQRSGVTGDLKPTPAQAEGPYYPIVDFSKADNNLTSTADKDELVKPILSVAPAFTLVNLNTATREQLLTIPQMNNRMIREFEEYRPYISIQQFRREIGKYVSAEQVAAYEKFIYVPVDVNKADAETLKQIPGVDDAIAAKLIAARPFGSNDDFLKALGAHLSSDGVALAKNYLAAAQ
jgi:DNA uptake protein ComE-like DNA-binding protein